MPKRLRRLLDPANVEEKLPPRPDGDVDAWSLADAPGSDYRMSAEALIRTYVEGREAEARRALRIERRGE